jgi:hypothetical protein
MSEKLIRPPRDVDSVSTSRSRDGLETFFQTSRSRLGLGHFFGRSRLGFVSDRKPNVSVSEPKVSFKVTFSSLFPISGSAIELYSCL